jgi:opacity protein-like surface antigen
MNIEGFQGLFKRPRRLGWIALLCFTLGIAATKAVAEEIDYSGTYAKLFGGVNFAQDSDFDGSNQTSFPSGEASLDAGMVSGLAVGYRFNRNFAAELDYAYRSNDIDKIKGTGGATIADGGDLASVAIMANGYYYFDFAETWSPYIGLGLGFLQEIDSDVDLSGLTDQTDLEDQVFAWQAMIGAEMPLNNSWSFYGEARFMSSPGPELSNANGSYDVDYENLSLIVGVGYRF